jgi:carboxypeptidase C (cathepsin A)
MTLKLSCALLLCCGLAGAALAQAAQPVAAPAAAPVAAAPATQPAADRSGRLSVTEHQVIIDGQPLRYRATAGFLPFRDEAGKDRASFFFVAYEKLGGQPPERRPITYVFNGGPGAASVWLHLGTAGPRRIELGEKGDVPTVPVALVANEATWLDLTDMVFIDPVGTGFSRPAAGEKGDAFYGVREDIASVAEFIRLYTTQYERWLSPKFLAGESYGSTRAAALSQHLVDRLGIALNGIMLISVVLDFQTIQMTDGNDLAYAMFLPAYTATAWHHKRLEPELQTDLPATLKQAEAFALGDYSAALLRGSAMPDDQRRQVVAGLARYTGLSPQFIERANLRINPGDFRKLLLEDDRRLLGRFDSRVVGFDLRPAASWAEYDPSLSAYLAVYTSTFNDYVRRSLGFETELEYAVLSDRVHPWNWSRNSGAGFLNVTPDLRSAMAKLPFMKVFFASGYFDLATPYTAAIHTINRLDLGPDLRRNISHGFYRGGHMMYHDRESRIKLKEDIRRFMADALEPR